MTRLTHRDIAAAQGLLIVGGYVLWEAQEMSVFGAIFPQLAGSGMVLGAFLLAMQTIVLHTPMPETDHAILRPILMLVVLALWAILLPSVGFVATSTLGAGLCMLIAQQDPVPIKTLDVQFAGLAGLVIFVAFLFGRLLNVPLP